MNFFFFFFLLLLFLLFFVFIRVMLSLITIELKWCRFVTGSMTGSDINVTVVFSVTRIVDTVP